MKEATVSLHPIKQEDLPKGWKLLPLGAVLLESQYGTNAPSLDSGNTMMVGMKNISDGKIYAEELPCVDLSDDERSKYILKKGDILINRTNSYDLVGKVGLFSSDLLAVFASYLVRLKVNLEFVMPSYLNYWLNGHIAKKTIKRISTRAIGQANINPTELKKYCYVLIPPMKEQAIIVDLLGSIDEAIAYTEKLIEAKAHQKRGLAVKLLFGKLRLGNRRTNGLVKNRLYSVPDDWKVVKIDSFAKEASRKNASGEPLPVLSCTKHQGLVDSLKYFGKQIFSKDTSSYKVVSHGQFAYATNHIEEGSIGYQDLYAKALVSPMYTVFKIDKTQIIDGYFFKLLKIETFRHIFQVNTSASVNRRGSLRWKGFSRIKVPCPSLEEQSEINNLLDLLQREITLLRKNLNFIKKQKRGLMQKLLTGEWLVNGSKTVV